MKRACGALRYSQDPDMLVHMLEGPVAQHFRPAHVLGRLRVKVSYHLRLVQGKEL